MEDTWSFPSFAVYVNVILNLSIIKYGIHMKVTCLFVFLHVSEPCLRFISSRFPGISLKFSWRILHHVARFDE